jgi:hypothetical protein
LGGRAQHHRFDINSMRERLNPRGYTWQKYLRTLWWRLALVAGLGVAIWRGTVREQMEYVFVLLAIVVLDMAWDHFGRYVWQGWRAK